MRRCTTFITLCGFISLQVHALDLTPLWDFGDPERSEANFRAALSVASGDDALILKTQIARTYSLRGRFETAREALRETGLPLAAAGPEAKARYWLELGRTYASHRHPPGSITETSKEFARTAFSTALEISRAARLDALSVDAIHMFAFVDTSPESQLRWGREALALVESSDQMEAKRWEPSIRSNLGEALFDLGRFDDAMIQFRTALSLRNSTSSRTAYRDNEWHIARTLRVQGQIDEALNLQLRLSEESESENELRYYFYDELALLYQLKGDEERSSYYRGRSRSMSR